MNPLISIYKGGKEKSLSIEMRKKHLRGRREIFSFRSFNESAQQARFSICLSIMDER